MSREAKEESHARIVEGAARLFREGGIERTSVNEVMEAAGLTHGGFYKHFDSKDALVEEALAEALAKFADRLAGGDPVEVRAAFRQLYLSKGHVTRPSIGCPVAALGTEIARSGAGLKRVIGVGVRRILSVFERGGHGSPAARRREALRDFSLLVGAVVIARAVDEELAEEVLGACRETDRRG